MEIDTMTAIVSTLAAACMVTLEVIVLIISAVWMVGKIQATTARLSTEIGHLADSVKVLHEDMTSIHDDVSDIQSRVAVLESKRCEGC